MATAKRQLIALCWALANVYCTLLDTLDSRYSQRGRRTNQQTLQVTQTAVKPEGGPKLIVVTCVQRRKYKTKSFCPVHDDGESRASQPE